MKKIFSLIAAVLFAGSMMAQVTITPGDFPETSSADFSTVKEGVTVAVTASTVNAEQIRIYKNQTITISAESNITKIEFTCTANGSAKYGPGCFAAQEGYTFDAEGPTGTWEGSATSVSFTAESNQVRATQIVVTLDGEPVVVDTYTVAGAPASVFGEEWNPALEANDMKVANGLYKWEKTELELAAGKIEFKVVKNHSWDIAYPAQNYELNIAEEGEYILTITFDLTTETVAAEALKKEPLADPTNCAEAAAAALSVSKNNEPYNGGKEYTIEGFVTEIATAYSEQYHNITFWMADTQDGGQVLEAYRAACASEEDAPAVGDKVAVTGKLTKYGNTPEFAQGCTFEIVKDEPVAEDEVVYNWSTVAEQKIGTILLGSEKITESTVKIHENTDEVPALKFEKSFAYADGHYAAIKPAEGGFKKGDQVTLAVCFSNSDDTKRAAIKIVAANGIDSLYCTALGINARTSAADPTVEVYTLDADQDSLLLGRYGNTNTFVTLLSVVRPAEVPEPETTWTVAGSSATLFGTAWDPTNKANDMEEVEGIFVWEKEGLELAAGDIAFKVVKDHAWDEAYPSQDYTLAIEEAGIYTIKITFNPESKEVAAEATKTGEAVVLPTIILHGNFTGSWADTEAFVPAEDKLTASLTLDLAEGTYEFGFKFDGAWKANGAVLTREANTTNLAEGSGNMKLTADQAGKYVIVYTYETQEVVVNYPAELRTYDVAEAIAAGLTDGTEVEIRGIITKMEIKGKNFAKYGSVNIYVADATNAEGEFEFYNCYSIEADTFRTTAPEYDPESSEWIQLEEAADANGNTIHVGDTVIAFGSYKLFNETHELNTGCYLVDIRHAEASGSEIALAFDNGMVDNTYFEEYGTSDIILFNIPVVEGKLVGDGDYLVLDLYPEDPNNITGAYSIAEENLDDYYTYLIRINGTDTAEVAFAAGEVAVEVLAVSVEQSAAQIAVVAALTSTTGDIYTVNAELVVYYDFIEQDVENVAIDPKAIKKVEMGQVIIEKNGVKYNVLGQQVR